MVAMERCAQVRPVAAFARHSLLLVAVAVFVVIGLLGVSIANARTTHIHILSRAIAFDGYSFPAVGQYEVITGIATGEVNPNDPKNAGITDIALAPRLGDGNVQYQHNFCILKLVDLSKGNHKIMYEPRTAAGYVSGAKPYSRRRQRPGGPD